MVQSPHLQDDTVLHAPGRCGVCDARPEWQAVRLYKQIAFTGEPVPEGWSPCPSSLKRPSPNELLAMAKALLDRAQDWVGEDLEDW
jgi:hypothetical protein